MNFPLLWGGDWLLSLFAELAVFDARNATKSFVNKSLSNVAALLVAASLL